ncbi:MAG: HNH endonuclease [Bradymonadaceae bacterium]|nr:HNH endonuclease [Lujinxingiaceae bacterium]
MKPALLLNASYEPLTIVSWKKAITLMWLGKAEVLSSQERHVHAATESFALPSVLRLIGRVRVPRHRVHFSRLNVYRRDAFRCQYCGDKFTGPDLTFDHVLPRSRGGETIWTNIVTSCQPCNRRKCSRTPAEARMPLLSHPQEPRWWPFSSGSGQVDNHPDDWKPYLWT